MSPGFLSSVSRRSPCLLNAVIVALAAGGTYDATTTGMVKKVKEEEFPLEEVEKDA